MAEVEWAAAVAPCIFAEGYVPAVLLTKSPKQMHKMSLLQLAAAAAYCTCP